MIVDNDSCPDLANIVDNDSCPDLGNPVTTDDEESESGCIQDSDCPCDISDKIFEMEMHLRLHAIFQKTLIESEDLPNLCDFDHNSDREVD